VRDRYIAALGPVAAWAWTALAGGGGLWLLFERGPWRLTNGWFALCSGLAACPLRATLARRAGIAISGRSSFAAAAGFWLAGQIARAAGS
jgi:hypothetical protein